MSDQNEIIVKLTALGDDFESGINSALGTFTKMLTTMGAGELTFAGLATSSAVVGGALFSMAEQAASLGESLLKMSDQTSISVEDLSLLKPVAEQNETSLSSLATAIKFMQKNLTEAVSGNAAAATSFKALGISVPDFAEMGTKDQLLTLADALKDVEDPALRNTLAMNIFGKSAMDIVPFLGQGSEAIKEQMAHFKALGLQMSGETAAAGDKLKDSLSELWMVVKQLSIDIGTKEIPVFTLLAQAVEVAVFSFKLLLEIVGNTLVIALAAATYALLVFARGFYFVSDAIGISHGKVESINLILADLKRIGTDSVQSIGKSLVSTGTAFEEIRKSIDKATAAQAAGNKETEKGTTLTDAQRKAILNEKTTLEAFIETKKAQGLYDEEYFNKYEKLQRLSGKSAQEAAALTIAERQRVTKVSNEELAKYLANVLDTYKKTGKYDEDYFAVYEQYLITQGKQAQEVAALMIAERKRVSAESEKYAESSVKTELDRLNKIKAYDENYFLLYAEMLRNNGADEKQVAEGVAREKARISNDELKLQQANNALLKTAYEQLGTAIKSIWGDSSMTVEKLWKQTADNVVDMLLMIALNAKITGMQTQVAMAEATAGISLVVGLLQLVFSGSGGGQSELSKATDNFLENLRRTLFSFEQEVLSTMELLSMNTTETQRYVDDIIARWNEASQNGEFMFIGQFADDLSIIEDNMAAITDQITSRYEMEKSLINDVMDLLGEKADFVRSIDQSIADVTRSTYTDEELLAAQAGDIQNLLSLVSAATGQDQIDYANELAQAYTDYYSTAQDLYSGPDLTAIQDWVVAGLESVKTYGETGYDELINVNLEMLGVQQTSSDLMQQMVDLLDQKGTAYIDVMSAMEAFGTAVQAGDQGGTTDAMTAFYTAMSALGYDIPGFATGAFATQPTLAMIAEAGTPEWVLPDSKLRSVLDMAVASGGRSSGGSSGSGGSITIGALTISMPNVKDVRDVTVSEWEEALMTMRIAAERLGRNNVTWGMA